MIVRADLVVNARVADASSMEEPKKEAGHVVRVHEWLLPKSRDEFTPRDLVNTNVLGVIVRWLCSLAYVQRKEAPKPTGQALSTGKQRAKFMPTVAYIPRFL